MRVAKRPWNGRASAGVRDMNRASHLRPTCSVLVELARWMVLTALMTVQPVAGQETRELHLAEECQGCELVADTQRVSTAEGDLRLSNNLFSSVRDSRGRLWLSYAQAALVNVVDTSGAFTGIVGRRGEGPGEFLAPGALIPISDSVLVFDPLLARVTVVGPDL